MLREPDLARGKGVLALSVSTVGCWYELLLCRPAGRPAPRAIIPMVMMHHARMHDTVN
jgi:hypothetical protein